MIRFCILGAGRIGYVHCLALSSIENATIHTIFDPCHEAAEKLAEKFSAKAMESELKAIDEPGVDAVIIAGPTPIHCRLIETCLKLEKPVFCEKPLSMDRKEAERCVNFMQKKGGICSMGFNRRYDPSFHSIKNRLDKDEIGKVESVHIISRDPAPPSMEYLKTSGGIFHDMMIHDIDLARWFLPEEPTQIFASGSRLFIEGIEEIDDYDAASVIIKTENGFTATITNSRKAAYGYDQRLEVLGERGLLQAENKMSTSVRCLTKDGITSDKPEYFFLERYRDAYRLEIENFISCIKGESTPLAVPEDGLKALLLADAAKKSIEEEKFIRVG